MDEYLHEMPQGWKNRASKPDTFCYAEDILFFLIFYPANVMILQITNHSVTAYLWPLILLAAMLASTLNRTKSRRMILFFPLQLVIAALVTIAAPGLAGHLLFGGEALIITIYALCKYLQDVKLQDPYKNDPSEASQNLYFGMGLLCFGTAALYITFLIALAFRSGTNQAAVIICYCCMLTVYAIYQHWSGTRTLMQDYKPVEASALRRVSRIFTVCVVFLIPIATAIIDILYLYSGLENIDYAIIRLLTGSYSSPQTAPQPTGKRQTTSSMETIQKLIDKPGKSNPMVGYILNIIFALIGAAIVLLLLIAILKRLRDFFALQKSPDEIHHSVFSMAETTQAIRSGVMRRRLFSTAINGKPNNIKVRKTFRRFVTKKMKNGTVPEKGDTPTDLMRRLDPMSDSQAASRIYEKARYSDQECTSEEVAHFKKLTEK